MMFSLSIFPHRSYKTKGRFERRLQPLFLTENDLQALPSLLKLYKTAAKEHWTKQRLSENEAAFEKNFPGRKFPAVLRTLLDFFEFREPVLEEELSPETFTAFSKAGIASFFDLKLHLYDILGKSDGFISLESRHTFLQKAAADLRLENAAALEHLLSLTKEEYQLLFEKEALPDQAAIVRCYKKHILETIIRNSTKLTIIKLTKTGAFVKDAIRFCKKFLLDFDLYYLEEDAKGATHSNTSKQSSEAVVMEVQGPREVSGSLKAYSWSLGQFINALISRYTDLSVEAIVQIRDKVCFYQFKEKEILLLKDTDSKKQRTRSKRAGIDSSVEERFQRFFQLNEAGWNLEIEPRPILFEGVDGKKHIIIPDFDITRAASELFSLEIIGYYRESYILKKLRKLWALKESSGEKIILLIDEKIAPRFKKLAPHYPIFTYGKKKSFPISKILKFLEENASSFDERLDELIADGELVSRLLTTAREAGTLSNEKMMRKLQLHSEDELQQLMNEESISSELERNSLIWLREVGLISDNVASTIKEQLAKLVDEKGIAITTLQEKLVVPKDLAQNLTAILAMFPNFEIVWTTLTPIIKRKQQ